MKDLIIAGDIRMKSILRATLLLFLLSCNDTTRTNSHTVPSELQAIITEFENQLKADLAKDSLDGSISAAIVDGNKIIWSKAFGYSDRDKKIFADTTTIYRTASISKSFTAFLMMKLVEDGIIKLTDPVEKYLPEIRNLRGYSDSTEITFLHLASHTSGLAREPKLEDANAGLIDDWEKKLLASIPTTDLESGPGDHFNYSNIGFGILGLALSRAADKPFMELMQEKVFVPLRMNSSFYVVPEDLSVKLAVGMERGSSEILDLDLVSPRFEHSGRGYKVPNGGIYSTPNDLAKFMMNNLGYNSILKKESLELMQAQKGPEQNKYGLGFMVYNNENVQFVGHNGQVLGYTSQFLFEKESKLGVILMRNYTWGATDLDRISFTLLSELKQARRK